MITEAILKFIFMPVNLLFDILPEVSFSLPDNIFNGLKEILGLLGFVFPIKGLLIILATSISIKGFHILWALILRIKSFIPTEGN